MNETEERKIAGEVRERFEAMDQELIASYEKEIGDYLLNMDNSYMSGSMDTLPDSFGLRLRKHLAQGGKPSEFFQANMDRMKGYISDELLPYFYKSVDSVVFWQIGWSSYERRSYRGLTDYNQHLKRYWDIIGKYHRMSNYGVDLCQILSGEVPEDLGIYFRRSSQNGLTDYLIAARLDEGDERLEELLTETFYGTTGDVNQELIRGIVLSHNERMFEVLGKTLLAARLSEGLRQAIAENMDYGTKEAFTYLLKVVVDNDLIRFASIRRAFAVFTGIYAFDASDGERIAKKTLALILRALTEPKAVEELLSGEDSMEIYIGLWSIAFIEIRSAMEKAVELCRRGSRHQRLVAAFFLTDQPIPYDLARYTSPILKEFAEDEEFVALILPVFMPKVYERITAAIYPGGHRYNHTGHYARAFTDYGTYFDSPEECREYLGVLYRILERVPKKGLTFEGSVFPWTVKNLTRNALVLRIAFCASALRDEEEIVKAASLLDGLNAEGYYDTKQQAIDLLCREPVREEILKILTEEVGDAQEYARETAYALLKQEMTEDRQDAPKEVAAPAGRLPETCYEILEGMLRFKKAEVRAHVLELLASRAPEEKIAMLERLFVTGKEEKVTAGLDLLLQMKKEEDPYFEKACEKIALIKDPSTKEQILIGEIKGGAGEETEKEDSFYDPEATYTPVVDASVVSEALEIFLSVYPNSEAAGTVAGAKGITGKVKIPAEKVEKESIEQEWEFVQKLDRLIEEKKELEYESFSGKELLGNRLNGRSVCGEFVFPFEELWTQFFEENPISDGALLLLSDLFDSFSNIRQIEGYDEAVRSLLARLFDPIYAEKETFALKYQQQVLAVLNHRIVQKGLHKKTAGAIAAIVCLYLNETTEPLEYAYTAEKLINSWQRQRAEAGKTYLKSYLDYYVIRNAINGIRNEDRYFPIHCLYKNGVLAKHVEDESFTVAGYANALSAANGKGPHTVDYLGAAALGIISKDYLYKQLLDPNRIKEATEVLSNLIMYLRESDRKVSGRMSYNKYSRNSAMKELLKCDLADLKKTEDDPETMELTELQKKKLELVEECYENISRLMLSRELVRGDTPTEYSGASLSLKRIYGLTYFVRILSALGKETLDRVSMFYNYSDRTISKRESMSHLLAICIPDPGEGDTKEQAGKLKKLLKGTDITESRLIEAGLYSPEWLPIISEYLGWEGFLSGCYYFMAHMNEKFDEKRAAVIAKYTPLSEEELNIGAFDVNWFRDVYETLGKKRFEEIYKAAKYISDGAKHTRARKYADASRGEMDAAKTAEEIEKKRNKDLLMAYALIPCSDQEKKDRYRFIRKYEKESKQFGAQRRASEKAAATMAVKNMATASGYPDETRFILKMEREISSELMGFFEPKTVGEYELCLEADENGKLSILITKGGKAQKSMPAALKKNEYAEDLTEAKKTFTEQYRRTRIMMEEAMENETTFLFSEILDLASDRVVGSMIKRILYKQGEVIGFAEDLQKAGVKPESEVFVAHPYHLFTSGKWHEFQKLCFDRQIKQPFKQIFRELYVKTEEEQNLNESMRYAGNQVNPKKTVALLQSRRWIADEEDGLQKVYYKENIIATLYAMADWFSPSDIEAPTLEWVAFYDRKTFEKKPIREIPEILFSEVMRDVDLAVSVAHAGEVDPEMSHSTIEMRREIAEFVVSLLKLKNVTFTGSHAIVKGTRATYNIHLGSGVIHREGGAMLNVLPVHSQNRGRIFLPFVDDDPKTAEIMSKIVTFAEDQKIKDPFILDQLR